MRPRRIVSEGRIVALDTPAALLAGLGREVVEIRLDHDPAAGLAHLRQLHIADASTFVVGNSIHIPLRDRPAHGVVTAIGDAGLATKAIATRAPTLDDVFLQLTGRTLAA